MDASKLTDYQLFETLQNDQLHPDIKKPVDNEFKKRGLSNEQLQEIIKKHEKQFLIKSDEGLDFKYKVLLIAVPFLVPIHGIIAARFIPNGHKKKTKQYWFYVCVGYLLWTIVVILFSRYILFRPMVKE